MCCRHLIRSYGRSRQETGSQHRPANLHPQKMPFKRRTLPARTERERTVTDRQHFCWLSVLGDPTALAQGKGSAATAGRPAGPNRHCPVSSRNRDSFRTRETDSGPYSNVTVRPTVGSPSQHVSSADLCTPVAHAGGSHPLTLHGSNGSVSRVVSVWHAQR